jgi:hypothetical protein
LVGLAIYSRGNQLKYKPKHGFFFGPNAAKLSYKGGGLGLLASTIVMAILVFMSSRPELAIISSFFRLELGLHPALVSMLELFIAILLSVLFANAPAVADASSGRSHDLQLEVSTLLGLLAGILTIGKWAQWP